MNSCPALSETYDFILWLKKVIARFPKNERYGLGLRLENKALDLLDNLIRAGYSRNKVNFLREANFLLEQIRFLLRLCKDCGHLSLRRYEYSSKCVLEIGRQVGGWIKSRNESKE